MDNKILFTDYNNDIDLCVDGFIIHTALSLSSLHKIEIDLLIDYINKIHDNNKLAIIGLDRIIEEDELSLMHKIIDKVIDRLKAEMSDLDLQIELQQLKIDQLPVEDKEALFSEKEKLLNIKQLKSNINKDIKDLEIQKAILTQNKGNS